MARLSLVLVVAAVFMCTLASAQPCIECRDCRTDNCYRSCRNECPRLGPFGPIRPDNIIVNGDACRNSGTIQGPNTARTACETTRKYCSGGRSFGAPRRSGIGATTLSQCSNIAKGACQGSANNARNPGHPCGRDILNGYAQCNAQAFRDFFEGETNDLCTTVAQSVTGVTPGTNNFINPILNLLGRRHA